MFRILILGFISLCFSSPTPRVVSLSPAITEMVFALGAGSNLVGVSQFSDFPKEAKDIPSVGPYTKPWLEKIVALKPTLVLVADEGPQDVRRQLELANIPYTVLKMKTLDQIENTAKVIAQNLGISHKGQKFSRNWQKQQRTLFQKAPKSKSSVLIEVQHEPLIVAGKSTFLNEITSKCGGTNVFNKSPGYPKVSRETAMAKKPQVVFLVDHFSSPHEEQTTIKKWKTLLGEGSQIIKLDPNVVSRPGPRLLEGAKTICKALEAKSEG